MNTEPTPFLFEGEHLVRVVQTGEREPWFVAADVCRVLGIKNAADALKNLDEDEKGIAVSDTLGGQQSLLIVSESGMYALIFRSRKPAALRFRKWVTQEVLPAIRRTGSYGPSEDGPSASVPLESPSLLDQEKKPFPDWPLEELRTKKGTADMYRMIYGVQAAQWIMPQLGFPVPPKDLIRPPQVDLLNWKKKDDDEAA